MVYLNVRGPRPRGRGHWRYYGDEEPRDGDYRAQCVVIEDGTARFERVDYDLNSLQREYRRSGLPEALAATWFDYTRRGVVDVHGLQRGPLSPRDT